jgi:hypothetical protein
MPVNGVTGASNYQYYVNDVNNSEPANRVDSRINSSSYNRPYSVNTENNRVNDRYQSDENQRNSRSVSTTTVNNRGELGNTIDLIA